MEALEKLNPQQRQAVLHDAGPLLILAGAGSGKTRVITTKIAYLVSQGWDPAGILAVTFTNRAATEMRQRVATLSPKADRVMIRTFHSFGAWLLRRNGSLIGLGDRFSIYDDDDQLALLKSLAGDGTNRNDLRPVAAAISRAKDRCLGPDDQVESVSVSPLFSELYSLYQQRLMEIGNVDFGDLIMRSVQLLETEPVVRDRIRDRFRVILVDEYQDSNRAQFLLLKQLYQPGNYLCVVGDEDQSIYAFRGAEVSNILDFPEVFEDTEVIRLEQNYRSTGRIVEAATRVVAGNQRRLGKTLWTENPVGATLSLRTASDDEEEARYCAQLLADGNVEETAILYRNNSQSRPFETHFQNLGIPYQVVGSLRFWERAEIKDAMAYMALLSNPKDRVAFERIINHPPRGIGAVNRGRIVSSGGDNYLQKCREARGRLKGKAATGLKSFLSIVQELQGYLEALPLSGFATALVRATGLVDFYAAKDALDHRYRTGNLEELPNACLPYPAGPEGLAQFLERTSLESAVDILDQDLRDEKKGVTLITAHNTKGLEFDRVIITGLEEGLFPYYQDRLEPDELEEERRLFYVALTRARYQVHLTTCRRRRVFGMIKDRAPSRFISEIPPELLESADAVPEPETEEDDYPEYMRGCGVFHDDYGPGRVTRKWRSGQDTLVSVLFEGGHEKRFILQYTNLERISVDDT